MDGTTRDFSRIEGGVMHWLEALAYEDVAEKKRETTDSSIVFFEYDSQTDS
ncbi:hypothetical protein KSD_70350 [Ktedonobacter sp. SOSP1-85]|nr:hypothetical protein KSD_70350 [Ktedonobacter sp. SOSP1-85]